MLSLIYKSILEYSNTLLSEKTLLSSSYAWRDTKTLLTGCYIKKRRYAQGQKTYYGKQKTCI